MRSPDDRSDDAEDNAVAALLMLHRRRQHTTARSVHGEYHKVVSWFERRAERLRGERLMTEELVERLLGASPALRSRTVQRELEIRGVPGGRAAGRVRVANQSSQAQAFAMTAGDPLADGVAPRLSFQPQSGRIEAGGSCWLRLEVDLTDFGPGQSVCLPLECRWQAGSDRIWLVVKADGAEGAHR